MFMNFGEKSVAVREKSGGQIFTGLKSKLDSREDLSIFYTPGIAEPCRKIAKNPNLSRKLTLKKNSVAVVSDGSAVLGLGDIGAEASLPVMEGKAMLFRRFGGVDAYPIVLGTRDADEIVETVARIAPGFGGINLEDISAPKCFEIERRLTEILDIPVFHDDQHGTAMVVLAALKNALRVVGKNRETVRVVFSGAGAAGVAVARLLREWGVRDIEMVDSRGIVACARGDLTGEKREFCSRRAGELAEALAGADVFIGVSRAGVVSPEMVRSMNRDAIVFAMANPEPEILPDLARAAGAAVVATGRSDFPNQINNVLIFPGFFRGLLDAGVSKITIPMKITAAEALADLVEEPTAGEILPFALDERVAEAVSFSVKKFAFAKKTTRISVD